MRAKAGFIALFLIEYRQDQVTGYTCIRAERLSQAFQS